MSVSLEKKQSLPHSRRLRIGLVTPAWPGSQTANGIATAISHIAAGLDACGHDVTIIAHTIDAPHDHPRVVTVTSPHWSLFDKLRKRLDREVPEKMVLRKAGDAIAAATKEAIKHYGIEVVVMEETWGLIGSVARQVPIPVIATLHGPWCIHKEMQGTANARIDTRRETYEAEALQYVRGIIAPAKDTLDRTAELWKLPNVPRVVIHNPMPSGSTRASDDVTQMLFVGRFDFHKGGDVLIEAFGHIARRHTSCRLTFVGPDLGVDRPPSSTRLNLTEAIANLPDAARRRIDVKGQCSREEVAKLRQTHGLTIVASRYENFGGTMLEAMTVGSALVCTRVGGCAEVLSHEETALLVPPDDPHAMADACIRLLNDPVFARGLGASAKCYVKKYLSPEVIGRQMADFLIPLCSK